MKLLSALYVGIAVVSVIIALALAGVVVTSAIWVITALWTDIV